jgi:hypothetical protein
MENVTFISKVTENCSTQRRGIHYSFLFDVRITFWSQLFSCSQAWHLFHFTIEPISFFPYLSPILFRYTRDIPVAIPSISLGRFNEFASLDSTLNMSIWHFRLEQHGILLRSPSFRSHIGETNHQSLAKVSVQTNRSNKKLPLRAVAEVHYSLS